MKHSLPNRGVVLAGECVSLREYQTLPFRLGNRIAKFPGSINPQLNCFVSVCGSGFVGAAMGQAARQLGNLSNTGLIFIAPTDDYFVFMHPISPRASLSKSLTTPL